MSGKHRGLLAVAAALACVVAFCGGALSGDAWAQGDLELRYELVPGGLPPDLGEPGPAPEPVAAEPEPADTITESATADNVTETATADNATESLAADQELRIDLTPGRGQESTAADIGEHLDLMSAPQGVDSQIRPVEAQAEAPVEPAAEPVTHMESVEAPASSEPAPELAAPEPAPTLDPVAMGEAAPAQAVDTATAAAAMAADPGVGMEPLPEPSPLQFSQAGQAAPVQLAAVELPRVEIQEAYTQDEIKHFLFTALYSRDEQYAQDMGGSQAEVRPKVVTRWEKDVAVRIDGAPTPDQTTMIEQTVAQLDAVLAAAGGIRLTLTQGEADLVVRVLDSPASGGIDGYTNKRYYQGDVIIGCDLILYGQGGLNRATVQREFLHALGFMGYDPESRATVLARPGEQSGQGESLPELDRAALAMLYSPGIRPGMDLDAVLAVLEDAWAR